MGQLIKVLGAEQVHGQGTKLVKEPSWIKKSKRTERLMLQFQITFHGKARTAPPGRKVNATQSRESRRTKSMIKGRATGRHCKSPRGRVDNSNSEFSAIEVGGFSFRDGLRDNRFENFDPRRDFPAQPGVQPAFPESKFGDQQPAAGFLTLFQAGPYFVD
ncbi:MAG: hypothetical protein ONB49_21595, partial [candidate division KSB1 bacterium]|nr:hypothetical protein [candidate division KSB1 bacterium]